MDDDRIERCSSRIAEERRLAQEAADDLAAELHVQKARLYETQLAILERGWAGVAENGRRGVTSRGRSGVLRQV